MSGEFDFQTHVVEALREIKGDVKGTVERTTTMEADIKSILGGDGRKGSLPDLEEKVEEHGKYIYKFLGALIVLAVLLSLMGGGEIWAHLLAKH